MKTNYRIVSFVFLVFILLPIDFYSGATGFQMDAYIFWNIRFPRTVTALLCGGGLATAGLLMQTFFRNSLASPDVLGVSSGAGAAVALVTILGIGGIGAVNVVAAALGALAALFLMILIYRRLGTAAGLIIAGLFLSSAAGALITVLYQFGTSSDIQRFTAWALGDFGGVTLGQLPVLTVVTIVSLVGVVLQEKELDIWLLGERYAQTLGIREKHFSYKIMLITAVLTGCFTAYCGIIAFVGIVSPHIARTILKTSRHRILIVGSFCSGAVILLSCDAIAHFPIWSHILPVNMLCALVCTPFIIHLLLKNERH